MENQESKRIAETTLSQIPMATKMRIGARNFTHSDDGSLRMTVKAGRKYLNVSIVIKLGMDDIYVVEIVAIPREIGAPVIRDDIGGVYWDMLGDTIEELVDDLKAGKLEMAA